MQMLEGGGGKNRKRRVHKRDKKKQVLNIYCLLYPSYDVEIT